MNRLFQIFTELAEEGKRQGSIRQDVASQDVAWTLLMFARTEDIAHPVGADEAIAEGGVLRTCGGCWIRSGRSATRVWWTSRKPRGR